MKLERLRQILLLVSAVAAAVCIAELLWLRNAQLEISRPLIAALFLPWLAAAAANLGVWYCTLPRDAGTPLGRLSRSLFWAVAAAFAFGFVALYGWLLVFAA